jgi:hypothetical protein
MVTRDRYHAFEVLANENNSWLKEREKTNAIIIQKPFPF